MSYQLLIGDSLDIIKNMNDNSVDLIVTDPAYESLEKHRSIGTTTRLKGEWFDVISNDKLAQFVVELARVLKPDGHCYIMCDQETHYVIRDVCMAMQAQKPKPKNAFAWKKFLVWDKVNMGTGYSWRAQHEVICFLEKGYRRLNSNSWSDVLKHKKVYNGYPTEKPVSLYKEIIENSSQPGDVVFDPFAGSGAGLEAACETGRHAIGIEIKASQAPSIASRLEQYTASDDLFVARDQMALAL